MWTDIKAAYRDSWKVALTFPLLFALPAAAEFAQHIVEYEIGMFASMAGMKAAADNGWRMGFGMVKILSLFLLGYWVSRALARLHGAQLRVRGDRNSARLFVGVLAWSIGTGMLQLFGGDLIAPFVPNPKALDRRRRGVRDRAPGLRHVSQRVESGRCARQCAADPRRFLPHHAWQFLVEPWLFRDHVPAGSRLALCPELPRRRPRRLSLCGRCSAWMR